MRFDCECVDVVIEYDDNGLIIRVYVETKENTAGKEERQKALEAALKQIERDFGQGAVMKLGESSGNKTIEKRMLF